MNENSQRNSKYRWLIIGLFLVWLAIVLASYYLVQNAFLQLPLKIIAENSSWLSLRLSFSAIGRSILDLLAAAWIAFVALGAGRWALKRIISDNRPPLEDIVFGLGLGFGILGLFVLVLGLAGFISQPIFLVLLVAMTLATGRSNLRFLRNLPRPRPGRLITLFIIISLSIAIMLALLPPTSWDGLFYHLTGPKMYIEQGAITSGIDIPHLNFPSLFEMLFLLALTLRNGVTAVLLHFIFALLLMGLAFLMARDLLRVRNAWSAVLFLIAIPMVLSLAGWAYNDLALAFYEVAALYALMKWRAGSGQDKGNEHPIVESSTNHDQPIAQNGHPQWLILSGISLGLALGLKYTGVVALFTLVGLMMWWYRRDIRRLLRPLAVLMGLALLVASPWFLKNLVSTGNPVYPFVFGGDYWDDFRSAAYSEGGTGIAFNPESCTDYSREFLIGQHPTGCEVDIGYLLQRVILLPLDITLGIQDASLDGPVGPLFLIFLPLLLIYGVIIRKYKRPAALGALLFFVLIQILFWAVGAMASAALFQSRLLLPALVALCPALSWILEDLAHLDHPRFSLQRLIYLVIGSVLLVGLLIQIVNWLPHQPWGYLLGSETEQENLRRRLGAHYVAMESINNETPEDAVITFLWEPRSYYCQRDCRPDSILDTFGHLQYLYGDANGMAQQLHDAGVGYVLLHEKGLEFVLEANSPTDQPLSEPEVLLDLRNNHLEEIASIRDGLYTLFRVKTPEQ